MKTSFEFDPSTIEPAEQFERGPIPPGTYAASILDAELKDTKSGSGQYINVTLEITTGDFSGRRVWHVLNVVNQSAQAESIGRQELAGLCSAIGLDKMKHIEDLIGHDVQVEIGIDKKDATRNRVYGYKAGAKAAPKAAPQPAQASAAPRKAWK
jgi:hypothetical protein